MVAIEIASFKEENDDEEPLTQGRVKKEETKGSRPNITTRRVAWLSYSQNRSLLEIFVSN